MIRMSRLRSGPDLRPEMEEVVHPDGSRSSRLRLGSNPKAQLSIAVNRDGTMNLNLTRRLKRMYDHSLALLAYAHALAEKDHADPADTTRERFPFQRLTQRFKSQDGNVPLVFGPSALKPYIGVIAGSRIDETHVADYPGVVMTVPEYDAMETHNLVLPTACDTTLARLMTREQKRAFPGKIVVVGLPSEKGANVMCTFGTAFEPNVRLVEWKQGYHWTTLSRHGESKICVHSDYVSIERIYQSAIPKGMELFVKPYSPNFFEDSRDRCDACAGPPTRRRPIVQCTFPGCALCFHSHCLEEELDFVVPSDQRVELMCPDHNEMAIVAREEEQAHAAAETAIELVREKDAIESLLVFANDLNVATRNVVRPLDPTKVVWVNISRASWNRAFGKDMPIEVVTRRIKALVRLVRGVSLQRIERRDNGSYVAICWNAGQSSQPPDPPSDPVDPRFEDSWHWP